MKREKLKSTHIRISPKDIEESAIVADKTGIAAADLQRLWIKEGIDRFYKDGKLTIFPRENAHAS